MSKRILQGTVISTGGNKSVVVRVDRRILHARYKKVIRRSKKYAAHDEQNRCKVGERVRIQETRPISKTKKWEVIFDAA